MIFNHIKSYFIGLLLPIFSFAVFTPFIIFSLFKYFILALISPFSPTLSYAYKHHSIKVSTAYDQLANASIGGNIDQTISGVMGHRIQSNHKHKKIYVIICKILNKFFSQTNHCFDAIEFDRLSND